MNDQPENQPPAQDNIPDMPTPPGQQPEQRQIELQPTDLITRMLMDAFPMKQAVISKLHAHAMTAALWSLITGQTFAVRVEPVIENGTLVNFKVSPEEHGENIEVTTEQAWASVKDTLLHGVYNNILSEVSQQGLENFIKMVQEQQPEEAEASAPAEPVASEPQPEPQANPVAA